MRSSSSFKTFSQVVIWCWLFLFAILPFCLIVAVSFMGHSEEHLMQLPLTTQNYQHLNNVLYIRIFEKSFIIAGIATFICLLLGYPFAYIVARMQSRFKNLLILFVMIPFWTSSLIRSYALIAMLKAKGILNSVLIALGIIQHPLPILFTNIAVM
ncbi:MAG: spermidine/putrescine ABC transporter permease PotB, partial [Gammaproteobacteria bacterium]|nr:spermidine/putrescine ABC transporter permease PotB [Gammaproteobacteria bacterium]